MHSTMKKTYLFYDIETTGLNKAFDQVLQFAAIRTDRQLNEIEVNIDLISQQLGREDYLFRHHFFLDLSFLIASWIYGYTKAVQLKFSSVKNFLSGGNRAKLDKMISNIKSEPLSSLLNKGEPYGMQNRKKP